VVGNDDPEDKGTLQAASRTGPHATVQQFRLTVTEGPDAGKTCSSTGERLTIGSHDSVGLVLGDRTVSRFHCEIAIVDGKAVIRDLQSRNGTSVDGVSVIEAHLHAGAVIRVGKARLRFDLGPGDVNIALSPRQRLGSLVGQSPAMRAVFAILESAAKNDSTVLIEGETGTGKEGAAEAVHSESDRREGPFIVVDCGAIPPTLLESELFGHERGAFTGAVGARTGAFEAASGGTIFLDEIGELQPDLQPKVLRALERREVKRVGANVYRSVDVRVVAATHRNLRGAVNAHKFRADLYYRLAVIEVRLPPLRERLDDLPLLVEHLLATLQGRGRADSVLGSAGFLAELASHSWPGNVRELRNYLERCLAMPSPPALETAPLEPGARPSLAELSLRAARDRFEREYLEDCLRSYGDNLAAAARAAGIDRSQLYRLLWKHGLKR
jgi:DNA-binding NtrC family response regulator